MSCCWTSVARAWRALLLCAFLLATPLKAVDETSGPTATDLWSAAKRGDLAALQSSIDAGVAVDVRTNYGATALAYASERGHLEIVKALVEAGADVNNKDTFYGFTPFSWAEMSGHEEVAGYLKENGGLSREAVESPHKDNGTSRGNGDAESASDSEKQPQFDFPEITEQQIAEDDRAASANNWPQFRGTGARGIADGQHPPVEWDVPEGNNLLWKIPIPGLGHSCPVIWEKRLYVTTAISGADNVDLEIGQYGDVDSVEDDSEHQYVIYCLDCETGAIAWQQQAIAAVPAVKRHLKSTHANATVATDGEHVIACFGSEGLYCYTNEGELVWKKDLGTLASGWFYDPTYQWEFGSSPILFDGLVIVQCDIQADSFLAAFHLADGEEIWRVDRDEIPTWSTPTVHPTPAGTMLITNGTRGIRGYDAHSGEHWWTLVGNSEIVVPSPIVAYETILVAAGYRPIQPIYAISLRARGEISLSGDQSQNQFVRWSTMNAGPYMPTPIAYRGHVYACKNSGIVACFDIASGEMVYKKRLQTPGTSSFVASPVAADGNLYFPAEDGHVLVVKSGPDFEELHQNPIGESVLATPAISRGTFYVRSQHHVIALRESQ
jgi:outer membrane protein assembly factor BamB